MNGADRGDAGIMSSIASCAESVSVHTYSRDDATERLLLRVYRRSSGAPHLIAMFSTSAKFISVPPRFETGATSHAHASSAVGVVDPVVKVESALLPSPPLPPSQFEACARAHSAHTHLPEALASFVAAPPPSPTASPIYFYSRRVSVGRVCLPPSKTRLLLQRRKRARGGGGAIAERCDRALHFHSRRAPPPREKSQKTLGSRWGRKPEQNRTELRPRN